MLEGVRGMSRTLSRLQCVGARCSLALLLSALSTSSALASPTPDMSVTDLQRHGREAVQARRFDAALEYYKAAFFRERTTPLLWDLALAQLGAHEAVSGLLSLRQYFDADDAEPQRKALAAQLIADTYGETGHLTFSGERTVLLDGHQQMVSREVEVDVTVGDHTVSSNQSSTPIHINAPAGQVVLVELNQLPTASITAAVSPPPVLLAAPTHSAKWPVTITFGASALAVAGGAVALNVLALHNVNEAVSNRVAMGLPDWWCTVNGGTSICQTLRHDVNLSRAEYTASLVVYGTAGALAVTSTLLGILWRPSDKESSANAWVLPTLGPGMIGAAGGARF